jgi:hypothetical protein
MTTRRTLSPPAKAAALPTSPRTRYEVLAGDVIAALDALMADVPKLEPKDRRSRAFIRTHIGVPFPFIMTTAAAVEALPELDRMEQMNVGAAWAARHLVNAFRPVVMKLITVTEELQTLLDTREATAAAEALKMYAIAQALNRRRNDIRLDTAVKQMKRDLGRRGRPRRKKAAAGAAPAPKKPRLRRTKRRPLRARLGRRIAKRE